MSGAVPAACPFELVFGECSDSFRIAYVYTPVG